MDFPIHSFFERNLQYIYDHVIYAYNLRLLKKKIQIKKRNSKGKAGLKSKSTFHAWIPTFFEMNLSEHSLSFPPYYLENCEQKKKTLNFERKSTSYRKPLQNHSCFLSQPFSKEDKGIFMIILFQRTIFLDVRTRGKKYSKFERECRTKQPLLLHAFPRFFTLFLMNIPSRKTQ